MSPFQNVSPSLGRLLALFFVSLLAALAPAQYAVTITGGTYTSSGANPTVTGDDEDGAADVQTGGGYYEDPDDPTDPDILASAGQASCQGAMTAHLHWTGAAGTEPPAIVVVESSTSGWTGDSGACTPGLSNPTTSSTSSEAGAASSSAVRYSVVQNPGADYDLPSVTPTASVTCVNGGGGSTSDVRRARAMDGSYLVSGDATVDYSVAAYPITVQIDGTVYDEDQGVLYGETGRHHRAYLETSAPGVSFSGDQWSISGGAFKGYVHGDGTDANGGGTQGYVLDLASSDLDQSSVSFYWKEGDKQTVSDSATVSYQFQTIGSVTADQNVMVERPENAYIDAQCSEVSTIVNYGMNSTGNPDVTDSNGDETGISYSFGAQGCPHFPPGTLYNAQLVDATWTCSPESPGSWVVTNGSDLDTSYPYNETTSVQAAGSDSDAPSYWHWWPSSWSVTTAFDIHLMYASADSQENDVPLYVQYWTWNGDSSQSSIASPTAGEFGSSDLHPTWDDTLKIR